MEKRSFHRLHCPSPRGGHRGITARETQTSTIIMILIRQNAVSKEIIETKTLPITSGTEKKVYLLFESFKMCIISSQLYHEGKK